MHVLIIPSEEFVPEHEHLAGIFQQHQAMALLRSGYKVGVLSVRQTLSIPMICKAIFFRLAGMKPNSELSSYSTGELFSLLYDKCFRIGKFVMSENKGGLAVVRIDGFYIFPPNKHLKHYGWLAAGMEAWKQYCSQHGKPDIIHAHNAVYAGMLAERINSHNPIPYCITEHSSYVARNLESFLIRSRIRKAYERAASFFVVSDSLGKRIDALYRTRFNWKQMPNVLDTFIEQAPAPSVVTSPVFTFISIGSLIPVKRHIDLIRAFHQQFSGNEKVRLKIGGEGPLKNELEEEINKLGLQHKVELAGQLDRKQVLEFIDTGHCLVLSSEFETFGVVLIEALSRGKPVIATSCGGPASIVNETNGLLCNVGDTEGMGAAMNQMIEQYLNYDQRAIRAEALKQYGESSFTEKITKEYRLALA